MAPSKQKNDKYVKFAWEDVQLLCEWDNCNEESNLLSFFLKHVDDHMKQFVAHPGDCEYSCLWAGCQSEPLLIGDLHCHVMFHAFHTKLKSHGHSMLTRKKLPSCRLENKTINLIPELPEGLQCQWGSCNDIFCSPESFYRHVDIHAEDYPKGKKLSSNVLCLWQDCKASFSSQYKLKEHFRAHTQEKLVACPTCGGMFASRTKLSDHVLRQNLGSTGKKTVTLYQCEYCAKRFPSERLHRDHVRCHVNHYKCPYCNMTCPTPSGLKGHILYRHSKEKHYSCQLCSYKAKSQNDMRRHMDIHNNSYYDCPADDCNYQTRSEGALLHHMRRFHQDDALYMCHMCNKLFSRGAYLTKHLMKSHELKWPAGHSRFRYKKDEDGYFRLQMVRYETIELSEQIQMLEQEKKPDERMDISQGDFLSYQEEESVDDPNVASQNENLPETTDSLLNAPLVIYISPASGQQTDITQSESGLKQIQLITTGSDGNPVYQTAEVLGEGNCE